MRKEFVRFQKLFTIVAANVIWDGFLSNIVRTDFQDIKEFIKLKMGESLEYLEQQLPTIIHTMKYYAAGGPVVGGEGDFTDISNLMPNERRTREEAVATIDELMHLANPHLLLVDNDLDATALLTEYLFSVAHFADEILNTPTLEELSISHDAAIAEILYVHLFECRENVSPKEITAEMENFIRNLHKPLLAGIMYRMKSGHAVIIDSFLEHLDSLKKIRQNPKRMLSLIEAKSSPDNFQLRGYIDWYYYYSNSMFFVSVR